MSIQQRYECVLKDVHDECVATGRNPQEVCLIAVSKTVDEVGVAEALEAGALDFGENRPDQIVPKSAAFPQATWHFIGNIQSRRIPEIVKSSALIHSVYKLDHAKKIDAAAAALGKVQDILVEVNVSGEESKSGITPDEALDFVLACTKMEHICVCGFMTMAPQGDINVARICFNELALLREQVKYKVETYAGEEKAKYFNELSMGMSEDWREAIAAGATMVRIGRAIFSPSSF